MRTSEAKLASARAWKSRNKERNDAYIKARNAAIQADPQKRARKLEQNKASRKRNLTRYREYDRQRDLVKKNARSMIRKRIWRGKLSRKPCEICGDPKSHAHHHDYAKPLEVRWLCAQHHKEAHHE